MLTPECKFSPSLESLGEPLTRANACIERVLEAIAVVDLGPPDMCEESVKKGWWARAVQVLSQMRQLDVNIKMMISVMMVGRKAVQYSLCTTECVEGVMNGYWNELLDSTDSESGNEWIGSIKGFEIVKDMTEYVQFVNMLCNAATTGCYTMTLFSWGVRCAAVEFGICNEMTTEWMGLDDPDVEYAHESAAFGAILKFMYMKMFDCSGAFVRASPPCDGLGTIDSEGWNMAKIIRCIKGAPTGCPLFKSGEIFARAGSMNFLHVMLLCFGGWVSMENESWLADMNTHGRVSKNAGSALNVMVVGFNMAMGTEEASAEWRAYLESPEGWCTQLIKLYGSVDCSLTFRLEGCKAGIVADACDLVDFGPKVVQYLDDQVMFNTLQHIVKVIVSDEACPCETVDITCAVELMKRLRSGRKLEIEHYTRLIIECRSKLRQYVHEKRGETFAEIWEAGWNVEKGSAFTLPEFISDLIIMHKEHDVLISGVVGFFAAKLVDDPLVCPQFLDFLTDGRHGSVFRREFPDVRPDLIEQNVFKHMMNVEKMDNAFLRQCADDKESLENISLIVRYIAHKQDLSMFSALVTDRLKVIDAVAPYTDFVEKYIESVYEDKGDVKKIVTCLDRLVKSKKPELLKAVYESIAKMARSDLVRAQKVFESIMLTENACEIILEEMMKVSVSAMSPQYTEFANLVLKYLPKELYQSETVPELCSLPAAWVEDIDDEGEKSTLWSVKESTDVCTYIATRTNMIVQPIFACYTCGLIGDRGCCVACAAKCHWGHDIVCDTRLQRDPGGSNKVGTLFFCDCCHERESCAFRCHLDEAQRELLGTLRHEMQHDQVYYGGTAQSPRHTNTFGATVSALRQRDDVDVAPVVTVGARPRRIVEGQCVHERRASRVAPVQNTITAACANLSTIVTEVAPAPVPKTTRPPGQQTWGTSRTSAFGTAFGGGWGNSSRAEPARTCAKQGPISLGLAASVVESFLEQDLATSSSPFLCRLSEDVTKVALRAGDDKAPASQPAHFDRVTEVPSVDGSYGGSDGRRIVVVGGSARSVVIMGLDSVIRTFRLGTWATLSSFHMNSRIGDIVLYPDDPSIFAVIFGLKVGVYTVSSEGVVERFCELNVVDVAVNGFLGGVSSISLRVEWVPGRVQHLAVLFNAVLRIFDVQTDFTAPVSYYDCQAPVNSFCMLEHEGRPHAVLNLNGGIVLCDCSEPTDGPVVITEDVMLGDLSIVGLRVCKESDLVFIGTASGSMFVSRTNDVCIGRRDGLVAFRKSKSGSQQCLKFAYRHPVISSLYIFSGGSVGINILEITDSGFALSYVALRKGMMVSSSSSHICTFTDGKDVMCINEFGSLLVLTPGVGEERIPITYDVNVCENKVIDMHDVTEEDFKILPPEFFVSGNFTNTVTVHDGRGNLIQELGIGMAKSFGSSTVKLVCKPRQRDMSIVAIMIDCRDDSSHAPESVSIMDRTYRNMPRRGRSFCLPLKQSEVVRNGSVEVTLNGQAGSIMVVRRVYAYVANVGSTERMVGVSSNDVRCFSDSTDSTAKTLVDDVVEQISAARITPVTTDDRALVMKFMRLIYTLPNISKFCRRIVLKVYGGNADLEAAWCEVIKEICSSSAVAPELRRDLWEDYWRMPLALKQSMSPVIWKTIGEANGEDVLIAALTNP